MKNHQWADGKLLQTNKKWSALKQSQREWIQEQTRDEHTAYVEKNKTLPMKKRKDDVIDAVYARVNERGIWIPYREFRGHVAAYIDKINHKSLLFVPPVKKASPPKPKIQRVDLDDFPLEVQEAFKEKLAAGIRSYINQTHRLPPNRIRDAELKNLIRGFNSKQWKPHGKQIQSGAVLLALYDELRQSIFAEYSEAGTVPDKINKQKALQLRNTVNIIETDRLLLRKLNKNDYREIKDLFSDPALAVVSGLSFSTKKETLSWIFQQINRYEKEFTGYFEAIDKERSEFIGLIGLLWSDVQGSRCLVFDSFLNETYYDDDFILEGVKALFWYGFELFGVASVYAMVRYDNINLVKLAERLGMALEGEFLKKFKGRRTKYLKYLYKAEQ